VIHLRENLLLFYKPLLLEAQHCLQEKEGEVDIRPPPMVSTPAAAPNLATLLVAARLVAGLYSPSPLQRNPRYPLAPPRSSIFAPRSRRQLYLQFIRAIRDLPEPGPDSAGTRTIRCQIFRANFGCCFSKPEFSITRITRPEFSGKPERPA
jgi:hypothetical protein